MADGFDGSHRSVVRFFLALLVIAGHVGIPIMLLTTLLSRRINRHIIFVNFCATWVIYSLSYSLLLYAGQAENATPSFTLCLTQAAMIYASPPTVGLSSLFLVLHLFLTLRSFVHQIAPSKPQNLITIPLLIAPYVMYIIIFTFFFVYGNNHPHSVSRSTFYCTVTNRALTSLSPGIAALALVLSLGIQIGSGILLRRNWGMFRWNKVNAGLGLSFLVRAVVFTFCAIISIAVCIAFFTESQSTAPNLVIAFFPWAVFLTFGTQSDFLREWRLKRRNEKLHERYQNETLGDITVHTPLTAQRPE